MKKLIFSLLLLSVLIILVLPSRVFAVDFLEAGASAMPNSQLAGNHIKDEDWRLLKLKEFLKEHSSPLLLWSEVFIESADDYGIDWRLLPAISGIESSFGKHLIDNSFNAYGWDGGYYRFADWPQSIQLMSQFLRERYYDRGLDTPQKIGSVYAPPTPSWGSRVNSIMKQIDRVSLSPRLEL